MTPDELRMVAYACRALKPGSGLTSRVIADIDRRHPVGRLAEHRCPDGFPDLPAALGELVTMWARITGRSCFVGDLNSVPNVVGLRLYRYAEFLDLGEPEPEDVIEMRRLGLLKMTGVRCDDDNGPFTPF